MKKLIAAITLFGMTSCLSAVMADQHGKGPKAPGLQQGGDVKLMAREHGRPEVEDTQTPGQDQAGTSLGAKQDAGDLRREELRLQKEARKKKIKERDEASRAAREQEQERRKQEREIMRAKQKESAEAKREAHKAQRNLREQ